MDNKIKVAIIFGGRSPEHQISLLSAQNVFKSLNTDLYEPILIGIDKNGKWFFNKEGFSLLHQNDPNHIALDKKDFPILLSQNTNEHVLIGQESHQDIAKIDVLFPVLHGTCGEDGSIQGFAKLANIPCVGCGIIGSAVGMDKDMMKRVLRDAKIKVANGITVRYNTDNIDYDEVSAELGHELFIKPANLGSSLGISFSNNESQFFTALDHALAYDSKVIVEQKVIGREIECAVLGNEKPKASIPGEVVPKSNFYSFENKYIDEKGAELHIPAQLNNEQIERIQKLAIETFKVLECKGMARVDMFLTQDDELIINEINTIPGFTNISMYPKLWQASGLKQQDLITELIELARAQHKRENNLKLI